MDYKGEMLALTPEEVISMVLAKKKEAAEALLGQIVSQSVGTVPTGFSSCQRQAIKDAEEPTAAALASTRYNPVKASATSWCTISLSLSWH